MSTSALKPRLQNDMTQALKQKQEPQLTTIRMLRAAIKQREIDEQIELNDEQIYEVIRKQIKQRQDSVQQYEAGHRPELAAKEKAEIAVLEIYLPPAIPEQELNQILQDAIQATAATGMKDLGKVMAVLKPKLQGRIDFGMVSAKLKALLNP